MNITKLNEKIKAKNQKFTRLTKAEKRVEIALDVLAQLKAKKIEALVGAGWGEITLKKSSTAEEFDGSRQLNELISTKAQSCTACALGAMFIGAVDKFNHLKVGECETEYGEGNGYGNGACNIFNETEEYYGGNKTAFLYIEYPHAYLEKFFPKKQLLLIETAFEGGEGATDEEDFDNPADYETAASYLKGVSNQNKRLELLMKNIVANNGIFDLTLKPIKRKVFGVKRWVLAR